jgi:hypothetical protein
MNTRVIKIGKGRHQSEQVVTTTFTTENGAVREHVTLATPEPISDTQRMRLMTYAEAKQSWKQ